MFASLPMYDRPQHRDAHDALWALTRDNLRAAGLEAPDALDHEADFCAGWGRPDLVLSQICNLPWRAHHRDDTILVGAADYGLPDVDPGYYQSYYVVRKGDPARSLIDLQGRRMAINEPLSHSGWGAAEADAAARGLSLCPTIQTGGHAASLRAVASGEADFASIDAQVWHIETRLANPDARALRITDRTGPAPSITFVTAPGRDVDATFAAVFGAIATLPARHRADLGLRGIVRLPDAAYDIALPQPPRLPAGAR